MSYKANGGVGELPGNISLLYYMLKEVTEEREKSGSFIHKDLLICSGYHFAHTGNSKCMKMKKYIFTHTHSHY